MASVTPSHSSTPTITTPETGAPTPTPTPPENPELYDNYVFSPLSQEEGKKHYRNNDAHVTCTFYKGKFVFEQVRQRIIDIIDANQWLLGSLEWSEGIRFKKSKKKGLDLVYLQNPPPAYMIKRAVYFEKPEAYNISDTTHYEHLSRNILASPCNVARGRKLIKEVSSNLSSETLQLTANKSYFNHFPPKQPRKEPIFKITFIPSKCDKKFAMVVSMSKLIADGFTYYKILNMFSQIEGKVETLDTERKPFKHYLGSALGTSEYEFFFSWGQKFNHFWHKKMKKKPIVRCYNVENDR